MNGHGEAEEITAVLETAPGRTTVEVRDGLRTLGRVSITAADVARVLAAYPRRFRHDDNDPPRWWPVAIPATRVDPPTPSSTVSGVKGSGAVISALSKASMPVLYRWQTAALAAWMAQGRRGVVEAVTGTGKTMVGVAATVAELAAGGQTCVIVPTKDLMMQWNSVLARCLPSGVSVGLLGDGQREGLGGHDVLVAIVNSARDADLRPRRPGGLLVADECHRYGSVGNRVALEVGFARRLGLSATYARADDGHLAWLDPYFGGTCYRMGYAAAIADRVVARFSVALVGVSFNTLEQLAYDELTLLMASARAQLITKGAVPAEPVAAFVEGLARLARRGDDIDAALARTYLSAMANRRRLMAETPAKLDALARLAPALEAAQRVIVFTQTISGASLAASALCDQEITAEAMHSGQSSKDRQVILAKFATGTLHAVVAPQVLDEGVDVPAADLAIILAASRSRRQMVQRMGRVLRRKHDGRRARFVVVFVEGTVEDPAMGAHEGFLAEVTGVAEAVRTFASGSSMADVEAFVADLGIANAEAGVLVDRRVVYLVP